MNNTNESGTTPATPAAALLFQAPQFVEPVASEPSVRTSSRHQREEVSVTESAGVKATKPSQKKELNGSKSSSVKKRSRKRNDETTDNADGAEVVAESTTKKQHKGSEKAAKIKKTEAKSQEDESRKSSVPETQSDEGEGDGSHRRRRRRSRSGSESDSPVEQTSDDQVKALKGSTRLEAKRMRRREGRKEGRKRQSLSEAEFLARRESVNREMVVRHKNGLDQIAVLEDGLLVEHYVARRTQHSIVGNIYLGRVQNVLPSMEAAFVDIGRGRNAVLYAGEVNWDALGMEGKPRRIESALKSGDTVLVQVTKDPIGHKGARLTSQITLAGRYLVLVPGSSMLGISRKLPDTERQRLKKILRDVVPEGSGVIVRTAAEGASEEQLRDDVQRLSKQWKDIQRKEQGTKKAPQLLRGEPELVVRVVRDIFNEDFNELVVQGDETWQTVSDYVSELSPELSSRLQKWTSNEDVFEAKRIEQQLAKGMDRKVWLPSGGTLVIDRTEALTVIDVNTGKFIGSGGTLEETVTRNNLESAEEIVRQLRLRDIGGIIIIDFVDMVLESNRELVLRRLIECLGRDRTRHQVTEITSLGLVQMTRKRVGEGLVEAFSTTCEACEGRGFIVHDHPVEIAISSVPPNSKERKRKERGPKTIVKAPEEQPSVADNAEDVPVSHVGEEKVKTALSAIAAATMPGEKEDEKTIEPEKSEPAVKPTKRRRVATSEMRATSVARDVAPDSEVSEKVTQSNVEAKVSTELLPTVGAKSVDEITLPEKTEKPKRVRRKVTSEDKAPKSHSKTRARTKKIENENEKAEMAKQAVQDLLKS